MMKQNKGQQDGPEKDTKIIKQIKDRYNETEQGATEKNRTRLNTTKQNNDQHDEIEQGAI